MKDILEEVGKYNIEFNTILDLDFPIVPILKSKGLKKHIEKRHPKCLKHLDKIGEILNEPDYVGAKDDNSVELIKIYDDNILLALRLDKSEEYFYVASLYDVSTAKLNNRIHSGRLKAVINPHFEKNT